MTDRVITASSGKCLVYHETGSTQGSARRNYTYTNGSHSGSIEIPYALEELRATSYIYCGFQKPEDADLQKCGPRCMTMWAHRNLGGGQKSQFFQCPITVSEVNNTNNDPRKQVPDNVAYLAAASIGVIGRGNPKHGWPQYQFSPFG